MNALLFLLLRRHGWQESQEASLIGSVMVFGLRLQSGAGASGGSNEILVCSGPWTPFCRSQFEGWACSGTTPGWDLIHDYQSRRAGQEGIAGHVGKEESHSRGWKAHPAAGANG